MKIANTILSRLTFHKYPDMQLFYPFCLQNNNRSTCALWQSMWTVLLGRPKCHYNVFSGHYSEIHFFVLSYCSFIDVHVKKNFLKIQIICTFPLGLTLLKQPYAWVEPSTFCNLAGQLSHFKNLVLDGIRTHRSYQLEIIATIHVGLLHISTAEVVSPYKSRQLIQIFTW